MPILLLYRKLDSNGRKLFSVTIINSPLSSSSLDASNDSNDSNHFYLNVYDIDKQKAFQKEVFIPLLISLDGISQIEYNNTIYLCGNQSEENLGSSSSFLISVNPYKAYDYTNILLSSIAHHYYPSMIGIENDLILALGGINQTICEYYSISQQKWKEIAKLPDGRYQGSLMHDKANQIIYLFGGYNHKYNKCNSTILTIETKHFFGWETILLKEGNDLMAKCYCGLFLFNDNNIIIFGGKNNEGREDDKVIEYNIKKRTAKVMESASLPTPAMFPSPFDIIVDKNDLFILDDQANLHKLTHNKFGQLSISINEVFKNPIMLVDN